MTTEEEKFDNALQKINAFKAELKGLLSKYNFEVFESDQYDGHENYCGTDYYFIVDGIPYYGETIEQILKAK